MPACHRFLAASLFLAACSNSSSADGGGGFALTLLGNADVVLHPGDQRTLQVVLSEDQAGPVVGASVRFDVQGGEPAGAVLDMQAAQTDDSGVATVRFTAGKSGQRLKVVASASTFGVPPVAFSFNVIPLRRLLQILATPTTSVSADGASATVAAGLSSSTALKVREVDQDIGNAIAGDAISFTLPPVAKASWSESSTRTASAQTGSGGEAQVLLLSTQSAEGPWLVTAQSAAGGAAVDFSVTVQPAAACTSSQQCSPGQTCVGGHCVDGGGDCTSGCGNGTTPDASGVWLTKHTYSIYEALPPALRTAFDLIKYVDQGLLGKLAIPGLPKPVQQWLNKLVSSILRQYLPDWLQQVVHIADDVVTVLSDFRAEGSMRLTKGADLAHLKGTEVWTSLVFYWLPLCNGDIGGPAYPPPDCARIDVATTDSDNPGEIGQCKGQSLLPISVQAMPFTAGVVAKGPNNGAPFVLEVDQRQVSVKMGKVILALIDQLISYVSPYRCIDEITDCKAGPGNCPLIDCYGLGQDADKLIGGIGTTVEGICDAVVTGAGQGATQALTGPWPINTELLDFSGHAGLSGSADGPACDSGTNCAVQLGNDSYDPDLHSANDAAKTNRDGYWSGDYFFKLVHKLPGAWEAKRPQ